MAKSGEYDVVFYWHNHIQNKDKTGDCLIVNSGEISGHKKSKVSFAVYDTENNDVEFVEINNPVKVKTDEVDKYLEDLDFEFSKTKNHQY